APEGQAFTFRARVPKGKYRALLLAGPIFRTKPADRTFLLRLEDRTILDAKPSADEYYGEKYLYRFLKTTYSPRPNALWEDYLEKMYPAHEVTIEAADGVVKVEANNHFLSALILAPESLPKKDWDGFVAQV